MTFAEVQKLQTDLTLNDRLSPGLNNALRSVSRFEGGMSRVDRGIGQVGAGLTRLATIGAGVVVGGFAAAVHVAADFESQLNTINTIARQTPEDLGQIGDAIRALARTSGADLGDLTAAYYDLLSAGIDVANAQEVLTNAQRLGVGALGTTNEAVNVLTTSLNAFNLSQSESGRVADLFAVAVERGVVKLPDIASSLATAAPLAAAAGLEIEELAAAFATLTIAGTGPAEAMTQTRSAILALMGPSADLIEVQKKTGIVFADVARDKGLVVALELLRRKSAEVGIEFGQNLFGRVEGLNFALQTTGPNFARATADLEAMGDAAGTLDGQVAEREKGLNFQLGKLKANLRDIGITVGSAVLPQITPLIEELTTFINENQPAIEGFALGVADAFRELVSAAKAGEFQPFIEAFKIMAEVGKKVVDIFRSLPPELQAIAITGLAVNKLAPSLIPGVANIGRGLVEIIFQRGASPANPLWVQSVAGGVGGGAAGGGGIASIVGIVGTVIAGIGLGTLIGNFLNENVTGANAPATTFERSRFEAILASRDVTRINNAIDTINDTLEIGVHEPLLGFAMIASGQAGTLVEQRDKLQAVLTEMRSGKIVTMSQEEATARARGQALMIEALNAQREKAAADAAKARAAEAPARALGQRMLIAAGLHSNYLSGIGQSQRVIQGLQSLTAARVAIATAQQTQNARVAQGLAALANARLAIIAAKKHTFTINTRTTVSVSSSSLLTQTFKHQLIAQG